MGSAWYQYILVSWQILAIYCFIKWFIFSTWPLPCGLYGVYNCQSIPSTLLTCWVSSAVNCGPLSDDITEGTPNLGIILFNNTLDTSLALLVLHGNAPGHLEKVSVSTNIPFLGSLKKTNLPLFPRNISLLYCSHLGFDSCLWVIFKTYDTLFWYLSDNGLQIRSYPFST